MTSAILIPRIPSLDFTRFLPLPSMSPGALMVAGALFFLGLVVLLHVAKPRSRPTARVKGLTWKRGQFCRGWLITGDTGSGKTSSGVNQLAHQVFRNEPRWGGLCIDEKGVYWETLTAMAAHHGRSQDLIHLRIRSDDANPNWTRPHRFNLNRLPSASDDSMIAIENHPASVSMTTFLANDNDRRNAQIKVDFSSIYSMIFDG